jgi:hypothetical protein
VTNPSLQSRLLSEPGGTSTSSPVTLNGSYAHSAHATAVRQFQAVMQLRTPPVQLRTPAMQLRTSPTAAARERQPPCPDHRTRLSCRFFPKCRNGPSCPYFHYVQPCKYGAQCKKTGCSYLHAFESGIPTSVALRRLLILLIAASEARDPNQSWVRIPPSTHLHEPCCDMLLYCTVSFSAFDFVACSEKIDPPISDVS